MNKQPKAVLHICCDEKKHKRCREALAEYFSLQGFVVVECRPSGQKEMKYGLQKLKNKYADIPHLLVGCLERAVTVQAFIKEYPEAVEGVILAGKSQEMVTVDENLPVLQIPDAQEDCGEMFLRIYCWAEERLDEMLYHAAVKY